MTGIGEFTGSLGPVESSEGSILWDFRISGDRASTYLRDVRSHDFWLAKGAYECACKA